MRNKARLWLSVLSLLIACNVSGQHQPCPEINILIKKADTLRLQEQYQKALDKLTIARDRCWARAQEIDSIVLVVFNSIEQKKNEALEAQKRAEEAERKVRIEKGEKEEALEKLSLTNDQLQQANRELAHAAESTKVLQQSLAADNTLEYILEQAAIHFRYDSILIRRDYQNALTYYALANFIQDSVVFHQMVQNCSHGLRADEFFRNGELDSAEEYYTELRDQLAAGGQSTEYEEVRLQHIREVRQLARQQLPVLRASADSLEFTGSWWTLPKEIYDLSGVTHISFLKNPAIRQGPALLPGGFPNLRSMHIVACPNLRRLQQWSSFPGLEELYIAHNSELETIGQLSQLPSLTKLIISHNDRLKTITGLPQVTQWEVLKVEHNSRLSMPGPLPQAPALKQMVLSQLEDMVLLDLSIYHQLESLVLDSIPDLINIGGLSRLKNLHSLVLTRLPRLPSIDKLSELDQLYELTIRHNGRITDLRTLDGLSTLQVLTIDSNLNLRHLPHWKSLPQLREIVVRDNRNIRWFGSNTSLKHLERAEVVGNKRLFMATAGLAPGWTSGGQNFAGDQDDTRFSFPTLTASVSIKWIQISLLAEYTIARRSYYFPSSRLPFDSRPACRDHFEAFQASDPEYYAQRGICDVNNNRFRLSLRYDVYPYFPIGPIYYMGIGYTPVRGSRFPFSLTFGSLLPFNQSFLSLDWRIDFSEIYQPHNIALVHNLSLGYHIRFGYKKTYFREGNMRTEGKFKPKRLF